MKKIWRICLLSILVVLGCTMSRQGQATQKPNILLIVADDLGYEMLGSYGRANAVTPHLDAMAAQGLRFSRAYASPVCTPSRMSLYTGLYASRHGYTDVLPVHEGKKDFVDFSKYRSYAQLFQAAGYQTSVTGKWQLAPLEFYPEHCREAGFDSWCVWQIWHEDAKTKRYWKATYNQDGEVRKDIEEQFGPEVMKDYVIHRMKTARDTGEPFIIQHNMVLPHVPIIDTPDDKALGREKSLRNMIGYMDKIVGELLYAVDTLGLADNTYVIFVGDNGTQAEQGREIPLGTVTGGKWKLVDGGMHVPLIIKAPDMNTARTSNDLVEITDFFPTFCELTGISIPDSIPMDGISFAGLIMGEAQGKREWVSAAIGKDVAVFDGAWRLHKREDRLYDCRELPEDKLVEAESEAAKVAREKLAPILERISQPISFD